MFQFLSMMSSVANAMGMDCKAIPNEYYQKWEDLVTPVGEKKCPGCEIDVAEDIRAAKRLMERGRR